MWNKVFLVFACAIAAAEAHGASHPDPATQLLGQCDGLSQADIRDCLQRKVRGSMTALARAEEKIARAVDRWDESEQFIVQARDRLRASKYAFLKHRDAQCTFASSLGGGAIGAAREQRRLACVYVLNSERTAALTRLAASISIK